MQCIAGGFTGVVPAFKGSDHYGDALAFRGFLEETLGLHGAVLSFGGPVHTVHPLTLRPRPIGMHGISCQRVSHIRAQHNAGTACHQVPRRLETMHSTPSQPLLKAVLWDMDGTLVDTEPYWIAAERALVESHGGTWTHQ